MNELEAPKQKLTVKQRRFIKRYIELGNGTKAAMEVYDTKDYQSAASIASENLKKLENPIRFLMEQKGIDMSKLLDVMNSGLEARRVISAVSTNKDASGATSDFIEVPDHLTRHKYLETAGKWLGIDGKESLDVEMKKSDNSMKITVTRG